MSNLSTNKIQTPLELVPNKEAVDLKTIRQLFDAIPLLKPFFDAESTEVMKGQLAQESYRKELANSYRMLAEIFRDATTIQDVKARVSGLEALLKKRYDDNLKSVFEQLEDTRQTLFSLKLCYENAPADSILLFPIERQAFVDRADDAYWEAMKKQIRLRFRKWDQKNAQAPVYLSFPFPLDTPDAARKVAEFAEEIVGLAMIDVQPFKKGSSMVEYMQNSFQVMNALSDAGAHLAIVGTHGYKEDVTADYEGERHLALPLGPALMGKMLETPAGMSPAGLNGAGLTGISGVICQYDSGETTDSAAFAAHGLIQIIDAGKIQGTATCLNGDIEVYNSLPLMAVFVTVQRSLIAFANRYAHGNWGGAEITAFTDQLLSYFNGLYDDTKGYRVIEDPVTREMIGINYNAASKTVFVSIPIRYKGVVSKFRFTLVGKNQQFDRLKKREIK